MSYSGLACARHAPWCLVSTEDEVCLVSLQASGDVNLVLENVEGPLGLAVIRDDSLALVSTRKGLVEVAWDEDGVARSRLLMAGWPQAVNTWPSSLAIDERRSGVAGRAEGTVVAYAAETETGRLLSIHLSAAGEVLSTRVAVEAGEISSLAASRPLVHCKALRAGIRLT